MLYNPPPRETLKFNKFRDLPKASNYPDKKVYVLDSSFLHKKGEYISINNKWTRLGKIPYIRKWIVGIKYSLDDIITKDGRLFLSIKNNNRTKPFHGSKNWSRFS